MIETADAVSAVLERALPLPPVRVPLQDVVLGSVLMERVIAARPLPPFPASVVDGYAVVAPVLPGDMKVVGRVTAGRESESGLTGPLRSGTCAYITTGAMLPEGANAVLRVEDTADAAQGHGWVSLLAKASAGQAVRQIGSDIKAGEIILDAGDVLGAAEVGLLATCGVSEVLVGCSPVVGVMSTGDELVDVREPLPPDGLGAIRDSNRPSLLAFVRGEGATALDLGIIRDDKKGLEAAMESAMQRCHVIITSGGVSMGEADFVKPLLERIGEVHFTKIRMKPGKPTTFATVQRGQRKIIVLALPGNPVSSLVTARLFASPAIKRLRGMPVASCFPPQVDVRISSALTPDPQRDEFHRAVVAWDHKRAAFIATSTGAQASSRLMSMKSANALLYIKSGDKILPVGTSLTALVIGPLPHPPVGRSMFPVSELHLIEKTKSHCEFSAAVITVSDRAFQGVYEDFSGPAVLDWITGTFPRAKVDAPVIVPDEVDQIGSAVCNAVDNAVNVVFTTGGTGFSRRDVTPEAIEPLLDRKAPGIVHALLEAGLQHTPLAVLSRPVAGVRGNTLIVTLPGSTKAVRENLQALQPLLPRIMNLLQGKEC
jgi:gephyrin